MDLVTLRSQQGAGMPNPAHSNNVEVANLKFMGEKLVGEEEGSAVQTPNTPTINPALTKDCLLFFILSHCTASGGNRIEEDNNGVDEPDGRYVRSLNYWAITTIKVAG